MPKPSKNAPPKLERCPVRLAKPCSKGISFWHNKYWMCSNCGKILNRADVDVEREMHADEVAQVVKFLRIEQVRKHEEQKAQAQTKEEQRLQKLAQRRPPPPPSSRARCGQQQASMEEPSSTALLEEAYEVVDMDEMEVQIGPIANPAADLEATCKNILDEAKKFCLVDEANIEEGLDVEQFLDALNVQLYGELYSPEFESAENAFKTQSLVRSEVELGHDNEILESFNLCDVEADGNCYYRAEAIYSDESRYKFLRCLCIKGVMKFRDFFIRNSDYLTALGGSTKDIIKNLADYTVVKEPTSNGGFKIAKMAIACAMAAK